MKYILWLLSVLLMALPACNTQKVVTPVALDPASVLIEERQLDTLFVTAPAGSASEADEEDSFELPVYNPSATRLVDLMHTKLDLHFDWEKERVIGQAAITLRPYFYPINTVTLDAKGFEFKKISLSGSDAPLSYTYDGEKVNIRLGKEFSRGEDLVIAIDYIATPRGHGGSAAINSDRGLFFINPRGEEPDKPRQIWTQGETESNSRWFPTIDKPNERATQEISLTVEQKFKTLSNGLLVKSTNHPDGTRTDDWKMDQPHAPYLAMIAVGDFAVVKEDWNGMPVEYYVEPAFEADAKAIFPHTREMLSFFSDKLGVKYPWSKYSQIVVRDYVSGAMENTTAVIFGEFMQAKEQELIDVDQNEKTVAHEMFHHWFGDLVTCESWANLTMNEGFANYSEYLWLEHKYGRDEADFHLINERNGYIGSTQGGGAHPLIHFGYDDREDMFDAHSYNKGGLVLHMLRNMVGDDAFFTALNRYLTKNAFTDVEAHELRLAFEDVTGQDLNWFFNQWYFSAGHPILDIRYDYKADGKQLELTVEQKQDPDTAPAIFRLPVAVDIYLGKAPAIRKQIEVNQRTQTFTFDVAEKPVLVIFDADRTLLCQKNEEKTIEEYTHQYYRSGQLQDRYEALENLQFADVPEKTMSVFKAALNDPFWALRAIAIETLPEGPDTEVLDKLAILAVQDAKSQVRAAAISRLGESGDAKYAAAAKRIIEQDRAYPVIGAALQTLNTLDSAGAVLYAQKLESSDNASILEAVGAIYAATGDASKLPFFEKNLNKVDGFEAMNFFAVYQELLAKAGPDALSQVVDQVKVMGLDMAQSPWRRFAATRLLHESRIQYNTQVSTLADPNTKEKIKKLVELLGSAINEIRAKETNSNLQNLYNQMIIPN